MLRLPKALLRPSSLAGALLLFAAPSVVLLSAPSATCADVDEYEKGKSLYANGKWVEAEAFFAKAIDGKDPTIKEQAWVWKGRMIRGACNMHLGRKGDAIVQFEAILRSNMKFEPDELLFPPGIPEEFKRTRERLEKEAAGKVKDDKLVKELESAKLEIAKLRGHVEALKAYSREERVVTRNSRLVASIPFGFGQFQNGQGTLGITFFAAEAVAFGTALTSFIIHQAIPANPAVTDIEKARSAESSSRWVNWVSSGAFGLIAITGILHAHLTFVPESWENRPRPLPSGLSSLRPVIAPAPGGGFVGVFVAF